MNVKSEPTKKTFTVGQRDGHDLKVGDIVEVQCVDESRLDRFLQLIKRPRINVVDECTATTFSLVERRMTWAEWRKAMSAVFRLT